MSDSQVPYYTSASSSLDWKSLDNVVSSIEEQESIIPESVIAHYMAKSGCNIDDPVVIKLMAASTHKYLAEILAVAKEFRVFTTQKEEKSRSLTNQALAYALKTKGVELERPQYFVDDSS